jgi:hypothetical protein
MQIPSFYKGQTISKAIEMPFSQDFSTDFPFYIGQNWFFRTWDDLQFASFNDKIKKHKL